MAAAVTIEHCGRTIAASVVAFDIRWSGVLPEDAELTWAVRVTSADGGSRLELAHGRRAGGLEQYARDLATDQAQAVGPDADLDGDGITVRFPVDVVGVAIEWPTWQAVLTVDGQDVATCAITL